MHRYSTVSVGTRILLGSLTLTVVAGIALMALGLTPAIAVIAALVVMTLVIGQRSGWAFAFAGAILLELLGNTLILRLNPLTGLDLWLVNAIGLTVIGLGGMGWLFANAGDLRLPTRDTLLGAASAIALPAVTGVVVLGTGLQTRAGWMTAYGTDSAWNTVASRFIVTDRGIAPWVHPNPSPLVNGLMATWHAPGRSGADELLRHDVIRQNELLLLLMLLTGVLAGIVLVCVVPARRPFLRAAAGVLGSAIPLSGYLAGYAVRFGFFSAPAAVAIMLCVWIVWLGARKNIVASIALLLVATTLLLAAWAPLALLPLALVGVPILMNWRSVFLSRGWSAVACIASAAQLVLYLILVTLPDFTRDGPALAADGGVPEVSPFDVALIGALMFVSGTLAWIGLGRQHEMLGVLLVLVSGGIGVAYLVLQRRGMDALWGYYPAKLGWLVSILLVVLVAASLLSWGGHTKVRGLQPVALLLATAAIVGLVIKVTPLNGSVGSLMPVVKLALTREAASETAREDVLFAAVDRGDRTIFTRFSSTAADDQFINYWSLQLSSDRSQDPIRSFAYSLDSTDAAQVCAAAETWGKGTIVRTRDASFVADIQSTCPDVTVSVAR